MSPLASSDLVEPFSLRLASVIPFVPSNCKAKQYRYTDNIAHFSARLALVLGMLMFAANLLSFLSPPSLSKVNSDVSKEHTTPMRAGTTVGMVLPARTPDNSEYFFSTAVVGSVALPFLF